jgi:uncharacterized sulfatase
MQTNRPPAVAAILFLLSLAATATAMSAESSRPNVLIVIADDQTYLDNGCYGSGQAKTPNIDRLASQGMRFTHCFTATAMCSPTRQQLCTGIYPVRNGAYPNHSWVKPGVRSIAHYFRELGYRVGLAGKKHFGPSESFPFENVKIGADFSAIDKFVNRDKEQPYLLIVASNSPHTPWTQGDASAYPPESLQLWPNMVDTPETRQAFSKYLAEVTDFDRQVGHLMKVVQRSGQENETIFVSTSEQGSAFPFCKWTCYDAGLRTALVVRWSDRVQPASVSNAMVQYVDIVPTLLDAASGKTVEGLDGSSFLPVLTGEKTEHRDVVYGVHTTRGIINATPTGYPVRSARDRVFKYIRNPNHNAAFENWVTTGNFATWNSWVEKARTDQVAAKLVRRYQHRPAEELYDTTVDPFELNNLADDPKYAAKKAALSAKLDAWMKQQGDLGMETEKLAGKTRQNGGKGNTGKPRQQGRKTGKAKRKPESRAN